MGFKGVSPPAGGVTPSLKKYWAGGRNKSA